jgi:hypothetical protein
MATARQYSQVRVERSLAYVIAIASFVFVWVCQIYLVFPIEQAFRGDNSAIQAFSYMFLPHGVKVLIALLFMQRGLPIILAVSFGFGIHFGHAADYALFGAVIASLTAILPLWLVNITFQRPLNYQFWNVARDNFSLFRFAFAISITVALLNSMFQAALAKLMLNMEPNIELSLGFLTGDIIGGFICIILTIFAGRMAFKRYGNVF